mmetsp:Transcript_30026/g.66106  ORF Transcript_30026/g.66106 Transcript_30026/m.66106 type:complete len:88 (-) Transcript_30026:684-947(-)
MIPKKMSESNITTQALLLHHICNLEVDHAMDCVAQGQDVSECAEWPNDIVGWNQPACEHEDARQNGMHLYELPWGSRCHSSSLVEWC